MALGVSHIDNNCKAAEEPGRRAGGSELNLQQGRYFKCSYFLDASTHIYEMVYLSVRPAICWSVHWSVR